MSKEELIVGFQNALERGQTIQNAMEAYLAAGYNAQEIQEAANAVSSGVMQKHKTLPESNIKTLPAIAESPESPQKKKMNKWVKVLLWVFGVLIVAGILIVVFGNPILNLTPTA